MTLVVLAVLVLAGLAVAQTDPGRDLLRDWGVSTPSEPYTEIAFAQSDALPAAAPGGAVVVPFTVHNAEGAARDYRWTATTHGLGEAPAPAASGRLSLADGASTTVRASIPVACAGERMRVDISIGGPHRAIGFWVPCGEASP